MKKLIIPVIIIILVIVFALYIGLSIILNTYLPIGLKLLTGAGLVILITGFVIVLVERIKEIKEENEDDLSKY